MFSQSLPSRVLYNKKTVMGLWQIWILCQWSWWCQVCKHDIGSVKIQITTLKWLLWKPGVSKRRIVWHGSLKGTRAYLCVLKTDGPCLFQAPGSRWRAWLHGMWAGTDRGVISTGDSGKMGMEGCGGLRSCHDKFTIPPFIKNRRETPTGIFSGDLSDAKLAFTPNQKALDQVWVVMRLDGEVEHLLLFGWTLLERCRWGQISLTMRSVSLQVLGAKAIGLRSIKYYVQPELNRLL